MIRRPRFLAIAATVAVAGLILAGASTADARVRRSAARAAEPLPVPSMPAPYVPADSGPCVNYANSPCCDPCVPLVPQVLTVCDPCTGCPIPVQVCLPACCDGEPCVRSRPTLFGCGLVRFDWCSGYGVTVRFTRCGDLRVIYH
jgi:hypothetical protein